MEPRRGFRRLERQNAEVEAALGHLGAELARRNPADVDVDERVCAAESRDERQHGVHRRFVGADQHPAAAQVAQVADGNLGFLGQAQQPLGVVAEEPSGVGQAGILGRPVEQPLADTVLEPLDRLTDGRLGTVQLHRGPREAPFGGHGQEDAQFAQLHGGFQAAGGSRTDAESALRRCRSLFAVSC